MVLTPSSADSASQLRRVLLNVLSLLGAYVLPRAFTFAAAVVAARVLGVATFGVYGSAAALAVILSIVATLGMMQLLVREMARSPERAPELVGAAHVAKTASIGVMLVALAAIGAGPLQYGPDTLAAVMLLGLGYAVGAYGENLGAYFQGIERMGTWLQAQALYGITFGGLGIVLVVMTRDLVWFCAAPVVGQIASVCWLLYAAPRSVRRAWRAPWPLVAKLLRSLVPFAAAFVLLTAFYKTDIVLLELWLGEAQAGLYAAAYKFVDVAQALSLVLAAALYPRLSRIAAGRLPANGTGGRWAAGRATELLILGAVPAAAVLWLLRSPFVSVLYGDAYRASAGLVAVLAPALPLLALNALGTFILAASERMRAVAALYLLGLVLKVTLNALLIPGRGAAGAAAAMLASEVAVGVGMVVTLWWLAAAAPRVRPILVALAAGGAAVLVQGVGGVPPGPAAIMYGLAVSLLYVAAGVLTRTERALLRSAAAR